MDDAYECRYRASRNATIVFASGLDHEALELGHTEADGGPKWSMGSKPERNSAQGRNAPVH
ncbi:hypothetical protein ColTof4_02350 [Colletotrichum tofieldiae]|nr:hypothetical protein ColTof3_09362 [Colletotrichum tofieldiae]GKT69927.1 hypothetical protein ColTof4_02350 [Colletotrichum tofieldiae]GKT92945.1 hypothetical protein Ct61P_10795 [Colletotrichum tofieldiae]